MSPEAQRIAISQHCGWRCTATTWHSPEFSRWARIMHLNGSTKQIPDGDILPDYLNDLNVIHEAEKVLSNSPEYCYTLCVVVYGVDWPAHANIHQGWWVVHATAAQRCEAFLRTLNLWVDTQ